ncbi:MAG: FAD-dependent oxidoreductase [Pyrobaculum sp.]
MRVVVVGGGAAGATAASRARRVNPRNEVVLIEEGPYVTHAPCAIPYHISHSARLYLYTAEQFARERQVRVYTNTRAEVAEGNKLKLRGQHGGVVEWDVLIVATGARAVTPRIEGVEKRGVYVIRHVAEVHALKSGLERAREVAIVGGGYVGVEMAEALLRIGKKVAMIESGRWLLGRMLDGDMAAAVNQYVRAMGAELILGEAVRRILGGEEVTGVETQNAVVKADAVVLSTGVRPNVELAVALGARLGETGAVHTDEYLETAVPGVYAAGDVAEVRHAVTNRPAWLPLAPYANKMGYVAGTNAGFGEKRLMFPPVAGASVTKFFEMYVGKVGLNEREAGEAGLKTESAVVTTRDKAHFMPDAREVHLKAVASGGALIGVQAVGFSPYVAAVIDFAAQHIGRPLSSIILAEYSYMPFTGPVWHPLITAARILD